MSCLSKTLSQTRDSPAPGSVRAGEGQGNLPPEYCAGYCRPRGFWQRCNFSLPRAGVRILTRTPNSARLQSRQQPLCPLQPRIQQQGDSCGILRGTLFSFKRKCQRSVGIVKLSGTNDCYLAPLLPCLREIYDRRSSVMLGSFNCHLLKVASFLFCPLL